MDDLPFIPKAESLVASFLATHPELADEFGYHKTFGPIMSNKGVRAFVEWAVKTKRCDAAKAERLIATMDEFNRRREK